MRLRQFSALGSRFDRYEFAAGEGLPAHQHNEDHLTLVLSGRIVALDNDTVVLNVFSEAR